MTKTCSNCKYEHECFCLNSTLESIKTGINVKLIDNYAIIKDDVKCILSKNCNYYKEKTNGTDG